MSKLDISGLDKKTQDAIEKILNPRIVSLDGLDKSTRHQIEDVLEADMKMSPDDAVRLVRRYLNDRKHKS